MRKDNDGKRYSVRFSSNYESMSMIVDGSVYELGRKIGNVLTIYAQAKNDKPIIISIFPAFNNDEERI